jgi:hypothetical protein
MLHDFVEVGLKRERRISPEKIVEKRNQISFHWQSTLYHVILVPATEDVPSLNFERKDERQIYLVNRPDWKPPKGSLWFDFTSMSTRYNSDAVHTGLRLFMLRYYGVRFSDRG